MAPGRGDLQAALDLLLTPDLGQVDPRARAVGLERGLVGDVGAQGRAAVQVAEQVAEAADRQDLHAADQRRLARVILRDEGAAHPTLTGERDHREDTVEVAHRAVEAELADDHRIVEARAGIELAGGQEDAEGDRQVVGGAALAQVGRGEVDGDVAVGEAGAGIAQGGAHALLRLLDGGVRQPDNEHAGLARADVDLDLDELAVEPDRGAAVDPGEHGPSASPDDRADTLTAARVARV